MDQNQQKSKTISHHLIEHQNNPTLLLDSLYCSEESPAEEESFHGCGNKFRAPVLLEKDLFWDDVELSTLFAKEEQNQLCAIVRTEPYMEEARRDAVEWMLKVVAHYSFWAETAVLAVNYLDRFLCSIGFQREKPWMTQLSAVACISLAAKVEETHVPLLLDLQVEESRFVFEAKTIQRMEILVLSTLQWKMTPVTPLSFLDYITRRLGLKDHLCWEFLRRCDLIVLSAITDTRFMCYLPSVMATATLLHVVNCVEPCLSAEYRSQLLGILGMDHKDNVDDCCKLVLEVSVGNGGSKQCQKRKFCSIPCSPNGVMEVSFSSDSSNDSWALSKKKRGEEKQLLLQTLSPH